MLNDLTLTATVTVTSLQRHIKTLRPFTEVGQGARGKGKVVGIRTQFVAVMGMGEPNLSTGCELFVHVVFPAGQQDSECPPENS